MKKIYMPLVMLLTTCLLSCTTTDEIEHSIVKEKTETMEVLAAVPDLKTTEPKEIPNLAVLCSPYSYVDHLVLPPPPLTGIERAEPIVLMTRQEFNERIQRSPLWESLYDKKLQNGYYGSRYSFKTSGELSGTYNYIYIESRLDGREWQESQRITQLSYGASHIYTRSKYQHQLLDQERVEMIETLKLAIEGIDDKTAASIIDKLYEQYMIKVSNKQYLSDGQTIHTYLEYDGKYIAMWGREVDGYKLPQCNYKLLEKLTIS